MSDLTCCVSECEKYPNAARGLCRPHYARMWKAGTLPPLPPKADIFWAKVDKSGECWEWTSGKSGRGYGQFRFDGRLQYAHRVAYELTSGPIPDGMMIDHICHNPACVRPDHLRPATNKQNLENLKSASRNSTSGVLGVSWHAIKRQWRGQVGHEGRIIHVGYFTSITEAEAAVVAKRNELFTHNNLDRIE